VLHPMRIVPIVLLLAAGAIAAAILLADRTERGTGQPRNVTPPKGLTAVSLKQGGANDFDPPPGDGQEHGREADAVLDRDPNSTWSTESYQGGAFASGKEGVGIYVDAVPSAAARVMELRTPQPGWKGTVYVAKSGPPGTLDGWQDVGTIDMTSKRVRVPLDTAGQRFRYYLVWITKLPPGKERAEISEILLFQ